MRGLSSHTRLYSTLTHSYTTSTSATLSLSATDVTSGVAQARFSNDELTLTPWEAYTTSKALTLTTGDGTKTVYYQIKDNAGLISDIYSDTIVLDTTPPTISITSPSDGAEVRSSVQQLHGPEPTPRLA